MIRLGFKSETMPGVLLAVLLIAAQSLALAHLIEHEAGALQSQACTTCVAANQLASACVDASSDSEIRPLAAGLRGSAVFAAESVHALVARQRGPPASN